MSCFGKIHGMTSSSNLDQMTPDQLRALAAQLLSKVDTMGRKIHRDETIIEQLSHKIAILKRYEFAKCSKQISPAHGSLLVVEKHVRGKWACRQCEKPIQAPLPVQVIDKGIPTAGLLAHVMVAKFSYHLPLYRQEKILGQAGLAIPRSTLARWVG